MPSAGLWAVRSRVYWLASVHSADWETDATVDCREHSAQVAVQRMSVAPPPRGSVCGAVSTGKTGQQNSAC